MRVVLASSNRHKLAEIRAIVPREIELVPQAALGIEPVPETGLTFVENALLKARHASKQSGLPAIADDSGLEVRALAGNPGIYSARYAGDSASDDDNCRKLLAEMADEADRAARFQCVIVHLRHALDPTPIVAQGTWSGEIAVTASGRAGFGYDPLFRVPGLDKTAAELTEPEKNQLSHRAQALKQLADLFRG